ncbi:hypothetical protein SAMN05421504_1011204 [Amycolatopsis xylanica]|uniref:Flavodoxin n=1 Tax=Amycolatopsis xylanica TaxID=589385 RepID=A0A1H2VEW2_9PSEU|nr:hypothetical protein [Amycolatopsis xylanica]SDW66895.1 hypothetical protein SAMN05421504_1011204 [Amycolatopsis xylanica]
MLERLDAELSETDEDGRKSMSGKVALVAVVGNEDGAHKIVADCYQALDDIGFAIPANGCTYWNSTITDPKDYNDLGETPEAVDGMTKTAAANAAHLARLLAGQPYPVQS